MYTIKQICINRIYSDNSLMLQNMLLRQCSNLKSYIVYDLNEYFDFTKLPNKFYLITLVKSGNEYMGIVNRITWHKN